MSGRLLGMDLSKSTTNVPSTDTTSITHALQGMLSYFLIIFPSLKRFVWTGENDSNTLRVDTYFLFFFFLWKTEGKNPRDQKIYRYLWTASHFGCALAHRRSDSAVSIRLMLNCDMFRFQYWGPYETTMVTACTGSSEKRQTNKIGFTRKTSPRF